ncbi:MAG TPA: DUF930 domain-containing protein [Xanthobacteraceae bacterium]|nr:DUF930 domain-containing protein [Xanthobacteraceae bacterium]
MKKLALVLLVSVAATSASALAASRHKRLEAQLMRLDPATRAEQVCDIEAMRRIKRDPNPYRPDRAVLAATSNPETNGHVIQGTGGAFRSKGKWYNFSFRCQVSDDHMKVIAFEYKLGEAIPEAQWAKDGLWE